MSYDSWKTRTDIDQANYGTVKPRNFPRRESEWRTCPEHGWAEHLAYPGDVPVCGLCDSERHNQRFNDLMAFVLGPRPE